VGHGRSSNLTRLTTLNQDVMSPVDGRAWNAEAVSSNLANQMRGNAEPASLADAEITVSESPVVALAFELSPTIPT
jgi:hypothetical protein